MDIEAGNAPEQPGLYRDFTGTLPGLYQNPTCLGSAGKATTMAATLVGGGPYKN